MIDMSGVGLIHRLGSAISRIRPFVLFGCNSRSLFAPYLARSGTGFLLFSPWVFVQDTDPVFSVFHPAERLNMIPSSAPPFFQILKSHGIGYGMNSVGTAAIKKLGVICGGRGKTRFIRFGRTLSLSLGTPHSRSGQ
jgi:hypothetical protein